MSRVGLLLLLLAPAIVRADDQPAWTRTQDVIYGRKHGMALTLDVFAPKEHANGAAVVWVVSGGWVSAHELAGREFPFAPVNELVQQESAVVSFRQKKWADRKIYDVASFQALFRMLSATGTAADHAALLRDLGVVKDGKTIRFDDAAPNATIRRAIMR